METQCATDSGILWLPKSSPKVHPNRRKPPSRDPDLVTDDIAIVKDQIARSTPRQPPPADNEPSATRRLGAVPARSLQTATQTNNGQDAHSYSILGSRRKKQAYPLLPISSESWTEYDYRKREKFVIDELRKQMKKHRHLVERIDLVHFVPCMVGTSPQTAAPSIIVWCIPADARTLRSIFKDARDKLYCGKQSLAYRLFKRNPPPNPPFRLVYSRSDTSLTRRAAWQAVEAGIGVVDMLSGAPLYYKNGQANLGITLAVGDEVLTSTVEHLFGTSPNTTGSPDSDEDTVSLVSVDSDQRTLNDDDLVSLDPLWDDDLEDDLDDVDASHTIIPYREPEKGCIMMSSAATKRISGHKVDGARELPSSAPFLDCAMIKLEHAVTRDLPVNCFRVPGPNGHTRSFGGIAKAPKSHSVPVYIVSAMCGVRTGRLLRNYAYLGAQADQEMSKVWTFIFDGDGRLSEGECGSVIVDQETFDVYGHVIGTNPMEHAYVVPFKRIIEQIKYTFETPSVSLFEQPLCSGAGLIASKKSMQRDPTELSHSQNLPSYTDGSFLQGANTVFENVSKNRQKLEKVASSAIGDNMLLQNSDNQADANFVSARSSQSRASRVSWESPAYTPFENCTEYFPEEDSMTTDSSLDTPQHLAAKGIRKQSTLDLRSLLKASALPSTMDNSGGSPRQFIPKSALDSILTHEAIAAELRRHRRTADKAIHSYATSIRDSYRRIFSILVYIEKADLIENFISNGVSDVNLPLAETGPAMTEGSLLEHASEPLNLDWFEGRPIQSFGLSCASSGTFGDSSLWREFYSAQWQFCTPVLERDRHYDFRDDTILPFVSRSSLDQGGFGEVHKVKIHPTHHHFYESRERPDRQEWFAVKRISPAGDADVFKKEVETYRTLNMERHQHVVKLLATYKLKDTYHLVLEYGDTLNDFMRESQPPDKEKDVLNFWANLIQMAQSITRLHDSNNAADPFDRSKSLQGNHQDIKPSNIVVSRKPGLSPFDFEFKLADFGFPIIDPESKRELAGMKMQPIDQMSDLRDSDFKSASQDLGIRYRETDLISESRETDLKSESRRSDIWSIGCIFLDVYAWTVLGDWKDQDWNREKRQNLLETAIRHKNMSTISEILQMTEYMLGGELDIPELLLRYDQILKRIHRDLYSFRQMESNHTVNSLSDKRAVDNFLQQHFARNPVVDPYGSERNGQAGLRQTLQGGLQVLGHGFSRHLGIALRKIFR